MRINLDGLTKLWVYELNGYLVSSGNLFSSLQLNEEAMKDWTKKCELAFCYSLHKEQIKGSGYVKETLIRSLHYKLQPFATFVFLFVIKTWALQWGWNGLLMKNQLRVGYALLKTSKHKQKINLDENDCHCDIFKP